MTKIIRFVCDTCGEQYVTQESIFYCGECHTEICEDCSSPSDSHCWDCYEKVIEELKNIEL